MDSPLYSPPFTSDARKRSSAASRFSESSGAKTRKRQRTVEGSCQQCLKARVKCSLDKPICKRCNAKKILDCNYDKLRLKWGKSMTINTNSENSVILSSQSPEPGDQFNKPRSYSANSFIFSGRSSRPLKTLMKNISGSVTSVTSDNIPELSITRTNTDRSSFSSPPSFPLHTAVDFNDPFTMKPSYHFNDEEDLQYFKSVLTSKFSAYGESIMDLDLYQLNNDTLLKSFAITLSSFHLRNRGRTGTNQSLAEKKNSSIKMLTHRLYEMNKVNQIMPEHMPSLHKIFDACVLLGILDGMIDDSNSHLCLLHLFGARTVFQRIIQDDANSVDIIMNETGLKVRIFSMFLTLDLIHSITSGANKPLLPSNVWYKFSGADAWFSRLNPNELFLSVFEHLSILAEAGYSIKKLDWGFVDRLKLKQTFEVLKYGNRTITTLREIYNSSFADAALVYYYRVVESLPINSSEVQDIVRHFCEKIGKALSTRSTLGASSDFKILEHCLLMPLLIIGSHCLKDTERELIVTLVSCSRRMLAFRNVDLLSEFLKKNWSFLDQLNNLSNDDPNYILINTLSWWNQFQEIANRTFVF